jgi:hypothetical protein
MVSIFVLPVAFRSIGLFLISPFWVPFFVGGKALNFAAASRRGVDFNAINRSVASLEATAANLVLASKTQPAVFVSSEEGYGDDRDDEILRAIGVAETKVTAKVAALEGLVSKLAVAGGRETCEVSKNVDRLREEERDRLADIQAKVTILSKKIAGAVMANNVEPDRCATTPDTTAVKNVADIRALQDAVAKTVAELPDGYSLGVVVFDLNNVDFEYKFGVRVGSVRNGKVEAADIHLPASKITGKIDKKKV